MTGRVSEFQSGSKNVGSAVQRRDALRLEIKSLAEFIAVVEKVTPRAMYASKNTHPEMISNAYKEYEEKIAVLLLVEKELKGTLRGALAAMDGEV